MQTSDEGLQAIMHREGYRTHAYLDTKGIPTIGVGHAATGGPPPFHMGDTWTASQILTALRADVGSIEAVINRVIKRPMIQNEFDAFASVGFNIGNGGFAGSSMVRQFNLGNVRAAADDFLMWEQPPEIKERREGERAQFLRSDAYTPLSAVNLTPDRSMTIGQIQAALNAHGAHIAIDGDIGPETLAAIRAFQTSHGLFVDGIAGSETQKALSVPA